MGTEQRSGIDHDNTRRSEQASLRAIVERMADGIVVVGLDGVIRFSNPAAQRLFGRSSEDLDGTNLGFPAVAGESAEIEIVRQGGESLSVEMRVVDIEWEGEAARLASLRDVTDRKRAEERASQLEEERLARAEAEAANRTKSEFLAMMSHELRTPLNAIIGYTELIQLGIPGALTDDQRAHVNRILTSARHLLGLVNEVLDLTHIDAGRLTVESTAAPAGAAVDTVLAVIQPLAEARGIAITVDATGEGETPYQGDESRVRQILVNLLGNAVKFTEPGGRVTIRSGIAHQPPPEARLHGHGPWVYLRVEDTGIGIPAEHLLAIFDPFVQVDTSHTRNQDGSGLGLTISRRLARVMHGDLTVRSEVGRGSEFTLWLPAATSMAREAATGVDEPAEAAMRHHGVADAGELLLGELDTVIDAFVARLRSERIVPTADSLRFSQLADQAAAYVADLAAVLVAVEEARGQPSSVIANASELQRFVAERHGTQRAALGWSRGTLSREWEILREEIERVVRRPASAVPEKALSEALTLIDHFVDQAREISDRALVRASRQAAPEEAGHRGPSQVAPGP
jgi:signal transduction histidine kinase